MSHVIGSIAVSVGDEAVRVIHSADDEGRTYQVLLIGDALTLHVRTASASTLDDLAVAFGELADAKRMEVSAA